MITRLCLLLILGSATAFAQPPAEQLEETGSQPIASTEAVPEAYVRRANFTSGISAHEPTDNLLSLANTETVVYFFTELRNFDGHKVTHRWTYKDELLAEVKFNVGGQRWRVWSKKNLLPFWTGDIKVTVIDDTGNELESAVLQYTEASQ